MDEAELLVLIFGITIFISVIMLSARIGIAYYSPWSYFQKDPNKFQINSGNIPTYLMLIAGLYIFFTAVGLVLIKDLPTAAFFGLICTVPSAVSGAYWILLEPKNKKNNK